MTRAVTSNSSPSEKIAQIAEDITFLPSPEQRKTKASFWALYQENPLVEVASVSIQLATQLTGDSRIQRWWGIPGFREWFTNKEEFRQRLEYLANLALDTAEQVLADPKANASARVNMAKLIIEAAGRMPNKWAKEQYLDERIGQMGKKELEAYIRRATQALAPASESTNGPAEFRVDTDEKSE